MPLGALAVVALAFLLVGARITRAAPEVALVAGWGACCLLMTAWATLLPLSLRVGFGLFAVLAATGPRQARAPSGLWRTALLSAPLFLVLAPALPSQVDTWLNLLPNMAYLFDHAALPRDGGPASWSFLPGAPYNTQFAGFAVSLLSRRLVGNALSLFNALLLCAAGLRLARVVAPLPGRPAWWACAAGLLLAVPLNPGFVPRVFLASYGEAPLAVTLMFAVVLGADLFAAMRAGAPVATLLASLALVLAAMVEIKQSALGLLLPFAATLLALGLVAPGLDRRRWAASVGVATAPALALYLLWRWYVLGHFAVGELKMLPFGQWHLDLLPRIIGGIAWAIFQKATYFIAVAVLLYAAWREARLRPWQHAAILLALGAGLVAGFNAFLLFTYVAHFPAVWAINAHSYFRYMSQLSLVVMLGLATWLRPAASVWLARWPATWRRRAAAGAVALAVAAAGGRRAAAAVRPGRAAAFAVGPGAPHRFPGAGRDPPGAGAAGRWRRRGGQPVARRAAVHAAAPPAFGFPHRVDGHARRAGRRAPGRLHPRAGHLRARRPGRPARRHERPAGVRRRRMAPGRHVAIAARAGAHALLGHAAARGVLRQMIPAGVRGRCEAGNAFFSEEKKQKTLLPAA